MPAFGKIPSNVPTRLAAIFLLSVLTWLTVASDATGIKLIAMLTAGLVFSIWRQPQAVIRRIAKIFVFAGYRIDTNGLSAHDGPAVIICNHVSFIDAILISAVYKRPIRFVTHYTFAKIPVLGRIFYHLGAIPIASRQENPAVLSRAFNTISAALADGQTVCIFPEGQITYDGKLGQFKRGIEHILGRNPVPVIPLAIHGLWGSFFSRCYGRAMTRPLTIIRRFRSQIKIFHHDPIDPNQPKNRHLATADNLHSIVGNLLQGDVRSHLFTSHTVDC